MTHDRHVRVYAWLARMLLPSWFHARVGHELVATFADRLRDAHNAGERRREIVRELVGLARIAVVSRFSPRRKPTGSVASAERPWSVSTLPMPARTAQSRPWAAPAERYRAR